MTRDHRASDQLTADTIHVPCPLCGAVANVPCTNRITEETARAPHWQRVREAERQEQP